MSAHKVFLSSSPFALMTSLVKKKCNKTNTIYSTLLDVVNLAATLPTQKKAAHKAFLLSSSLSCWSALCIDNLSWNKKRGNKPTASTLFNVVCLGTLTATLPTQKMAPGEAIFSFLLCVDDLSCNKKRRNKQTASTLFDVIGLGTSTGTLPTQKRHLAKSSSLSPSSALHVKQELLQQKTQQMKTNSSSSSQCHHWRWWHIKNYCWPPKKWHLAMSLTCLLSLACWPYPLSKNSFNKKPLNKQRPTPPLLNIIIGIIGIGMSKTTLGHPKNDTWQCHQLVFSLLLISPIH